MDAHLEAIYKHLRSDKVKERKEALKQLLLTLDSPKYLAGLDAATAALPPHAPVPGGSWPGVAHVLTRAVGEEVRRKRGPDPMLQRAFRTLVARAEEGERRCGQGRLLLRRAAALFAHVADVLEVAGLGSPIGAEYSAALRGQLLAAPEYVACSSALVFQGLLATHMSFLERCGLARAAEEAARALATMGALLGALPGDLQPLFQADCLLFFSELAERLAALAEGGPGAAARLAPAALSAVTAFLLANGRDVAAQLPTLHAAYAPVALRASGREPRLRDAALTYLRAQLALGTLPHGSAALGEVVEWLEREMGQPGFKWGEDGREGRLLLGPAQAALLDLAAAAYFHASGAATSGGAGGAGLGGNAEPAGGGGDDSGGDELERPPLPARKRRRALPALAALGERLAAAPALWAPVAARLLLSYGLALPAAAYAEWLRQLAAAAPARLPRHFMRDEHDADAALWLLRLAHALALAWPLHLTPAGRGAAAGGAGAPADDGDLPPQATLDERWLAVWECAVGHAQAPNVQTPAFAACLAVLSTAAQRGLLSPPPGFHRLWGLPLLQQAPSLPGLGLLAAAASAGRDAAIDGAAWQPAFLEWVRAAGAGLPPEPIVAALAAVLRLPEPSGSGGAGGGGSDGGGGEEREAGGEDDAPSLGRLPPGERWWQWWQEDGALAAQLSGLTRGELLLRARALALLESRRRERAAAAAALHAGRASSAAAPEALQRAAAEALEERLEDVLRQAPSPLSAPTSLHAQQNSRLAQLLGAAAAGVALSTAAASAAAAAGRALAPCWQPGGALAAKLAVALQQCGALLAESCKRLEGLLPVEEHRLRGLVTALRAYRAQLGCGELSEALLQCMGAVQDLFLNASAAVGEAVRATQAAAASRGMAAASAALGADFFDDDLDVGGRAPAAAGTHRAGSAAPAAVSSSAAMAGACKTRCAALLALLGPLSPPEGATAAAHWLDQAWQEGKPGLPEEAHLALLDALVRCAAAAMPADPAAGAAHGLEACRRLSAAEHGLLSWAPRHHNGRCLFAMRRVRALAAAGAAAPPAAAAAVEPLLRELVQVADDCFLNLAEAERKGPGAEEGAKATGWRLRVALADTLCALLACCHRLMPAEVLRGATEYTEGLLGDDAYGARLAGARLVQVLVSKYSDKQAVFDGLKQHLSLASLQLAPRDNGEQHVETSVVMLAETAAGCGAVELDCLFLLCGHAAAAAPDLPLAAAALDWLSARLGYPQRHAYAAWHLRGLLYHWCAAGWTLVQWVAVQALVAPTPAAAAAGVAGFVAACAAPLTAVLAWGQRQEELAAVAQMLGMEPAALVVQHFEWLLALAYPHTATGGERGRELVRQKLAGPLMSQLLPAAEVDALIKRRLTECVAQLLLMARGGVGEGAADPPAPWFSGAVLVRAVHSLAEMGGAGDTHALLDRMLSRDHLARILLAIHANLELARHPRHQGQALAPLHALLALLGDRVREASTLRYAASVLLRLLPVRELQEQVCGVLSAIVGSALRQPDATPDDLAPLGALLPALLSTLAEGVEAEHRAGRPLDSQSAAAMLALAAQLTTGAPPVLRAYLRQVDPLPDDIPALQQPAALVAEARRDITPAEQLSQFAARASSMTPGLRRRSLAALRRVLDAQQAELLAALSAAPALGSPGGPGGAGGGAPPGGRLLGVVGAAWQLAVLSGELADAELAELAGELLALAGPLDPAAIAFDPAAAFSADEQQQGAGAAASGGASGPAAGRSQGTQTPGGAAAGARVGSGRARASPGGAGGGGAGAGAPWAAALQLLGDYLVDDSVDVIRVAQATLRLLLATPEGGDALAQCGPAARPYLEAFRHADPAGGGPEPADGEPQPQLGCPSLWRCDARPYGAWVCDLACAVLQRCASPTLSICAAMAHRKPAYAELLLPHAFADLAVQPAGGAMALELGALVSQQLLPRLHRHPKAARLLLSCLNHLRCQYLDAKLAGGGGGRPAAGKAAAEIELWRKVYWIEVDYLELAAAAAHCGAHFTSLLCTEAWREACCGWLAPLAEPGAPVAGGGAADAPGPAGVEQLLLDTYSQINEPDALYAVARSHSTLSQLKRFEHEGDWPRALLAYDLALQSLAPGGTAPGGVGGAGAAPQRGQVLQEGSLSALDPHGQLPPGPASASGASGGAADGGAPADGVSREAAVAGLLRSLGQLGAGHLLRVYGASPEAAEQAERAALGLGQWAPLGGGGGGGSPSADASLAAALAGLQAGSMERCRAAVSGARRGLVAGLVTASLEGAAHINPALVQLQQAQAVSEAWELLWPAMPDLGSVGSPKKRRRQRPAASGGRAASGPDASTCSSGEGLLGSVLQLWRAREAAAGAGGRYNLQAPLQGMHLQLLHSLGAPEQRADWLVRAAVAARKTDHFAQATTALFKLRGLLQQQRGGGAAAALPAWAAALGEPDASWRVEEAKLLWAQGQQDTAVQLARGLLGAQAAAAAARASAGGAGVADGAMRHAALRALTAKWLAATRFDSPSTVLSLMQEAADEALGAERGCGVGQRATACRVLYRLAHYADTLYRGVEAQKASAEHKTARAVIEAKRKQIREWQAALEARRRSGEARVDKRGNLVDRPSRLLAHHIATTSRPLQMDEAEQQLLDAKERQFLRTALLNYARCLRAGDGYDLPVVFRVMQLWLRLGADAEVNELVGAAFRQVPSCKFLPLVYQAASRLSAARAGPLVDSGFQAHLAALLTRLGCDHPHHTLYQLFSLKNGNRGKDGKVAAGAAVEAFSYAADLDKVAAAQQVLARVAAHSPAAAAVVREMGELVGGYIELAAVPPPSKEAEEMAFPAALRRALRNFTHVPVASVSLPVDPTCRYEGVPHFVGFSDRIRFAGGVNKPKIVCATDSEGGQHRQLVKSGNDDLRQDAVMQQFFWLVNAFLAAQPATRRRALHVRTYKVVPFSPSSGLLEWVEHTLPAADYLLGPQRTAGAHARYRRPGDLTWVDAYNKLAKATQSGGGPAALRAAFDAVTARFPPALHHFFLERFRDPGTWFERRLAYTRSVAVSSMAGHVIGLGDRHLQNVLLDVRTADAVHIDLGIAFEQGRFLNTPELVPFRLTRDLVDGMGVTGVEGVMRRCCEETLRVLRASKESVLTVVEVFIHDPLYQWALTTTAAARRQADAPGDDEDDEGGAGVAGVGVGAPGGAGAIGLANADAERTLLRIKQKLEGVEAGEGEARGVEGQVQQLLQDAQDPDKLSRMYIGWQAWC